MKNLPRITSWAGSTPPTEATLRKLMAEEGFAPYAWSNGAGDTYSAHTHGYDKVIYVARGSITFGLPELGQKLKMKAGDRLDLPAGVLHNAQVGSEGVLCLEGHK